VDPDPQQIEAAAQTGAPAIELHTGAFCDAPPSRKGVELERVRSAARLAASLGIEVHAGHGLHYHNVAPIAATPEVVELNIGHSIVARAVFTGLEAAVREMKALMLAARS
jgi:pyridoxine 5-phosphate synthase